MHSSAQGHARAGLKRLVAGIEALPSPSSVAGRILDLAVREDVSLADLIELIETDPSLGATLLKLANLASQGPVKGGAVRSVRQATMLMGLETVRTVALCVAVRDGLFAKQAQEDGPVRQVWKHSLACAVAAQLLAERSRPALAGAAFAAGLLHDCGKLVMLSTLPGQYDALLELDLHGTALIAAEQNAFGADHCLVGKWLLERWRLPALFVDSVWLHHQAPDMFADLLDRGDPLPLVVLADQMAHEALGGPTVDPADPARRQVIAACGLPGERAAAELASMVGERFLEKAALFNFDQDPASFYFTALQRANAVLGRTALELRRVSALQAEQARSLAGVAEAGALLENARDATDVLVRLARSLSTAFACPEGMVCMRESEDSAWQAVFWDHKGLRAPRNLPEDPAVRQKGLRPPYPALLETASVRLGAAPAEDGACLHLQHGFVIATARLGRKGGHVELLLRPPTPDSTVPAQPAQPCGGARPTAPSDHAALRHLALLGAGALRRIALLDESSARAENLAEAMRSMRALNAKLLQTERLAAVGQLAAGAAHEINNPLAIVSARAQLLEMQEKDPDKKRGFHQMVDQIERISAILSNLMDFARPAPPRVESVRLADVLARVLDLVRGGLMKRNIEIVLDVAPDLPALQADSRQLEQVFLNLVINAEHAMEASGGRLTVSAFHDARLDQVEVVVADTGVGITKDNLEKIFDPFFTTKPEGKGTGLGLSTSYALVANHRGEIVAESEPGQGTRMRVRLPRAR